MTLKERDMLLLGGWKNEPPTEKGHYWVYIGLGQTQDDDYVPGVAEWDGDGWYDYYSVNSIPFDEDSLVSPRIQWQDTLATEKRL